MKTLLELFHDMIIEPWTSRYYGWFDRVMSVVFAGIAAGLLWLICYTSYDLIDWVGIDSDQRPATVESTHFSPGFWSTTVISDGKTTTYIPIWIPESYQALVLTKDGGEWVMIGATDFSRLRNGQKVTANCGIGRLSGKVRVMSFAYNP